MRRRAVISPRQRKKRLLETGFECEISCHRQTRCPQQSQMHQREGRRRRHICRPFRQRLRYGVPGNREAPAGRRRPRLRGVGPEGRGAPPEQGLYGRKDHDAPFHGGPGGVDGAYRPERHLHGGVLHRRRGLERHRRGAQNGGRGADQGRHRPGALRLSPHRDGQDGGDLQIHVEPRHRRHVFRLRRLLAQQEADAPAVRNLRQGAG